MVLALVLLVAAADEPTWTVPAVHGAALVVSMRVAASMLWPADYDPRKFGEEGRKLRLAFTRPPEYQPRLGLFRSDGDPWAVNVFGHGAFGSEVYLRARQCGHGPMPSFAAVAVVSTGWEYVVEGLNKRPSAIDLVWTPVVGGLVLGEGRFRLYRWLAEGAGLRRALRWAVDPFGELERGVFRTGC